MNYEDWGMTPAQDFMVPVEYHDRYGYLYPSLEPTIEHGMMHPIMYPDIYYRIYPYAHRTCERMDNPYMYYPSEAQVESMVTDCYDACLKAMPDLDYYADLKAQEAGNSKAKSNMERQDAGTVQFRRRPLLRDLIAIILISELFRRRRRNPYDNNNGYRPGAGYGYGNAYEPGAEYGNGVYGPGAGYSIGAGYGYEAGAGSGYGPGAGYNLRSGCSPCGGNYNPTGYGIDDVKKLFPF